MNVGNQMKISGALSLVNQKTTGEKSLQLLSRLKTDVELLRQGLRFESGLARIQVTQAISLLEGKIKTIIRETQEG